MQERIERFIYIKTDGQLLQILNDDNDVPDESAVIKLAFSTNGNFLASIHKNKELKLWEGDNYQLSKSIKLSTEFINEVNLEEKEGVNDLPKSLIFGNDNQVFVGFENGIVCLYDRGGNKKWGKKMADSPILNLDYEKGQLLVCHSKGLSILEDLGSLSTPSLGFTWQQPLVNARFLFDNEYLLLQETKKASLLHLPSKKIKEFLLGHSTNLIDLHLIQQTQQIYTSARDGKVFLWDIATEFPQQELSWEGDNYFRLLSGQTSTTHFLTSRGAAIQYWSIIDLSEPKFVSNIHQKQVLAMKLSEDGKSGVSADQNNLLFWKVTSNGFKVKDEIAVKGRNKVQNLAFDAPNNKVLYSYRRGNELYLWDVVTSEVTPLKGHQNTIKEIPFFTFKR